MTELLDWLRSQLDEDERVARAATERQPYDEWDAAGAEGHDDVSLSHWEVVGIARAAHSPAARSIAEHIARWDPARVLAEIEAKRRILDLHEPQPTGYVDGQYMHGETGQLQCAHCAEQCHSGSGFSCDMPDAPWPCPTVRLLVQPYAGRPGWRKEWAA